PADPAQRGVSVLSRVGSAPHEAPLRIPPGEVTALTVASGSGKTTAAQVVLGVLEPERGQAEVITADGTSNPISSLERRSLWDQLVQLPQRPVLPGGTIGSVLAAARPEASAAELEQAATAAALGPVIDERGWDADLGRSGQGISLGE